MRYLLHLRGDKQEPGCSVVSDDYRQIGGEVVVDSSPEGKVWDAASQTLKERTSAETLSHAKAMKEAELRDRADAWYQGNVRGFEGAVVVHKIDRSQALSSEEQAIRDEMNTTYSKLRTLIGTVRAASTVEEVQAVTWT